MYVCQNFYKSVDTCQSYERRLSGLSLAKTHTVVSGYVKQCQR